MIFIAVVVVAIVLVFADLLHAVFFVVDVVMIPQRFYFIFDVDVVVVVDVVLVLVNLLYVASVVIVPLLV